MKDVTGQDFGQLTIIYFSHKSKSGQYYWHAKCSCGTLALVNIASVRKGSTTSCGCYRRKHSSQKLITHGMTDTPTWRSWSGIKQRCHKSYCKEYRLYGARGITVCDRWLNSFEAFFEDMGERTPGLSIERKDNNLGYSPENCIWADQKTQQNNRRNNYILTYNGTSKTLTQWAETVGIDSETLRKRIMHTKWPVERALSEPLHNTGPKSRKSSDLAQIEAQREEARDGDGH